MSLYMFVCTGNAGDSPIGRQVCKCGLTRLHAAQQVGNKAAQTERSWDPDVDSPNTAVHPLFVSRPSHSV
jgi:hypothetical protein